MTVNHDDFMAAIGGALAKSDLRPRQRTIYRDAIYARVTGLGSGNYLVPVGSTKSGQRLVDAGLVTKVDAKMVPDPGWLVVRVNDDDWKRFFERYVKPLQEGGHDAGDR